MKKNYTVTLEEDVWQRLEDLAREQGLVYQGRLSRSAVIERLVLGGPATAGAPAAAQSGPVQPAPVDAAVAAFEQPSYRLADVVARWPEKTREQWQQEEWKAGRWVKLVLATINGTP